VHRHRSIAVIRTAPFFGPIPGARQNPAAHGGVTNLHRCGCGAMREENRNAGHVERGPWYTPGDGGADVA